MITCGEFLRRLDATTNNSGKVFVLETWSGISGQTFNLSDELTKEIVLDIAGRFIDWILGVIAATMSDELYLTRRSEGHRFLAEIVHKARDAGVQIDFREVRVPLTWSERLTRLKGR